MAENQMVKPQKVGKKVRMSFSKIEEPIQMPDLLEVQKGSYRWFMEKGNQEVLEDVSPIVDYSGNLFIDFVSFSIDESKVKYPVEECKERDANYAAPLKVDVRLSNKLTGEVKQSEIFMGDFPIMTDKGTFVINGAERVIVSQIVRSPGIYYSSDIDKTGKHTYATTVIPYRGAWLEYETDANDVFYVRIDKNRKIPVTVLIHALGIESEAELRDMFGDEVKLSATLDKDETVGLAVENNTSIREEALKEIYKKLRPGEPAIVESAEILINNLFFDPKRYDLAPVGRYKYDKKLSVANRVLGQTLSRPAISPVTGEIVFEDGRKITEEDAREIERAGVNEVYVRLEDGTEVKVFSNMTVYPADVLGYDLTEAGIDEKVRTDVLLEIMEEAEGEREEVIELAHRRRGELSPKHITREDILSSINYLLCLSHGIGTTDDIDHLGNRRLRCVGELLQNQLRIGLSRMDKIVKERMTIQDQRNAHSSDAHQYPSRCNCNTRVLRIVAAVTVHGSDKPACRAYAQAPSFRARSRRACPATAHRSMSETFTILITDVCARSRLLKDPTSDLSRTSQRMRRINKYGFIEAPYRKR